MSGLYNVIFGDGQEAQRASILVKTILNLDQQDVGRFRDCWLEQVDGDLRIAIYTRNGGGNRPDYQQQIDTMRAHPEFLSDRDDEFDSTYATFYFHVPDQCPPHLVDIDGWAEAWEVTRSTFLPMRAEPPRDMDARWQSEIMRMNESGPTEREMKAFEPVAQKLKEALNNPGDGPTIITIGTPEEDTP